MAVAERHLAMTPSPTERAIDDSRLKWLREAAANGLLVNFQWTRAELDGELVRMNGQHSSKMLTELNGAFPEGLFVHLDTYEVDEKSDLALLFRQFDARKSARSPTDVSGAYQGLHPALADVPRTIAKLAVEGVAWNWRHVEGTMSRSGDNMYTLFDNATLHPFIKWIGELQGIKTPELQTAAVVAAMFSTFEVNMGEAKEFWPRVAKGGSDEPGDPASVLDIWLERAKTDGQRALNLKPGHLYQGSIYAWNAYRTGREIKDIKVRIDKGFLSTEH
jgi:hypothetical protein